MTNTIDLLEAIGSDASLRHASSKELSKALEQVHASEALTVAVASGDCAELSKELGNKPMLTPQVSQGHFREDDEPQHEDDETPHPQPTPGHDKSSPER